MTVKEILAKLKSLGDEKVRAHNKKWGVDDNQFGVKMGDIRKMADSIKVDHKLAMGLWETGNMEAMLLAILIIDKKSLSTDDVDKMVQAIKAAQVADWFNSYIVKEFPDNDTLRKKMDEVQGSYVGPCRLEPYGW